MTHFLLQPPSLEHVAGVKIVAHLWSQRDVFAHIRSYYYARIPVDFCEEAPEWPVLTGIVKSKVRALPLPERSKKHLAGFIKPLGIEIIHWCKYCNEEKDSIQFPVIFLHPQLHWTMRGTIDYAKTAELMVKDERVDLEKRFQLACINCLEDEARELFDRVAAERGEVYVPVLRYYVRQPVLSHLMLFFTRSINLNVRHESPAYSLGDSLSNIDLLKFSLYSGNRAMSEHLLQTLNQAENAQFLEAYCGSLLKTVSRRQFPTRSMMYYLSLMNEEQRRFIFRNCIAELLSFLLNWPAQSLFVKATQCGWQYISSEDCTLVLLNILHNIKCGWEDYDYCHLFRECWRLCSVDYKRHFFNSFNGLSYLFATKREEFIVLILKEAPSYQILSLCNESNEISYVLMDESVISEAALTECKQTAGLNSANEPEDEEKRLRSQHLTRLVDLVMGSRMERRNYIFVI